MLVLPPGVRAVCRVDVGDPYEISRPDTGRVQRRQAVRWRSRQGMHRCHSDTYTHRIWSSNC